MNPAFPELTTQITRATEVQKGATILINGFGTRLQEAVDAALANGATEAELAPVIEFGTALKAETDALAAAVEANT